MTTIKTSIETIKGPGIPLRANDIDTDRIIPARYLRCVSFDGLGEHAFEDDREQDKSHPFNKDIYKNAKILIAGSNFGCGSSREHAPQSLKRWGIDGIIAESFAEIFFGNCMAIGLPCFTVSQADAQRLFQIVEEDPTAELVMDVASATVTIGDTVIQAGMPQGARESLVNGSWNATAILLQAEEKIQATANCLPYIGLFNMSVAPQFD